MILDPEPSIELSWRRSLESDDEAIIALSLRLYEEDPSPEAVPRAHTLRTLVTLRAEPIRGRAVVLAGAQEVVGYALLVAFWSNELGGETCEIDELYVTPEHRSKGLASKLLRSVAEGKGPWDRRPVALGLQVTPDNARAKALYLKLGFREWKNQLLVWRLG